MEAAPPFTKWISKHYRYESCQRDTTVMQGLRHANVAFSTEVNVTAHNGSGQGTGSILIITIITSFCLFPPISYQANSNSTTECNLIYGFSSTYVLTNSLVGVPKNRKGIKCCSPVLQCCACRQMLQWAAPCVFISSLVCATEPGMDVNTDVKWQLWWDVMGFMLCKW